jgi:AcrR family transcriptional regulator
MPRIQAPTVAEHNAMRRAQVIRAAADVLAEGGLRGFTPASVAKRAGLARSSMYQYYPSTDAMLGTAVAELLRRSRDRIVAEVSLAETPADRVAAYLRAAFADAAEGHNAVPDLSGVGMPDFCREAIRGLHEELIDPLCSALAEAGVATPRVSAQLVQGLVNAAVSAIRHGADPDETRAATVDLVQRGLGVS